MLSNTTLNIAWRYKIIAHIVAEYGSNIIDTEDPFPIAYMQTHDRVGATDSSNNLDAYMSEPYNMCAAVMIACSITSDESGTLFAIPETDKMLLRGEINNIKDALGIQRESSEDFKTLLNVMGKYPYYQRRTGELAEALLELSALMEGSVDPVFKKRTVISTLAKRAVAGNSAKTTTSVEIRDEEARAPAPDFAISENSLQLSSNAKIVTEMSRSDEAGVQEWLRQRIEGMWLGASVAASCLGIGAGYDTPEEVYESIIQVSAPKKVTNGMVSGTVRQEEVIESAIATLEDKGLQVTRLLPRFGEITVARRDADWDIATLDAIVRLQGINEEGEEIDEICLMEVKVPGPDAYRAKWRAPIVDADKTTNKISYVHIFPPEVGIQVQDQLRITGYQRGIIAAMGPLFEEARADGKVSVVLHDVYADPDLQQQIETAKTAMHRCVTTKTPPSSDTEFYGKLPSAASNVGIPSWYSTLETRSKRAELDVEQVKVFRALSDKKKELARIKKEEEQLKSECKKIMGIAEEAIYGNELVAEFRGRKAIDREILLAHPGLKKYYLPGGEGDDAQIDYERTLFNNPTVIPELIGTAKTAPRFTIGKDFAS